MKMLIAVFLIGSFSTTHALASDNCDALLDQVSASYKAMSSLMEKDTGKDACRGVAMWRAVSDLEAKIIYDNDQLFIGKCRGATSTGVQDRVSHKNTLAIIEEEQAKCDQQKEDRAAAARSSDIRLEGSSQASSANSGTPSSFPGLTYQKPSAPARSSTSTITNRDWGDKAVNYPSRNIAAPAR